MRYLFIIQDPEGASSRYRVLQYLPAFEAAGVQGQVERAPLRGAGRRRLFDMLDRFDLVLIQKKLFTARQVRGIRRRTRTLVYDFDDAIMFRDTSHRRQKSFRRRRKFAAIARTADLVIAGNDYLAGQARLLTDAVTVLPTALDPARYQAAAGPASSEGPLTLGWIGSASTLIYLEQLRPALVRLATTWPAAELKVICDDFPDFPFIGMDRQPWSEEAEAAQLQTIDIGLAPLPDDPWSRGKCGLKILQYYAAGKPVVGSRVGVQQQMIQDGATGFLASSADEWVERVGQLIASEEARLQMGRAGRKLVEEAYSVEVNAPRLVEALQTAAARHKKALAY